MIDKLLMYNLKVYIASLNAILRKSMYFNHLIYNDLQIQSLNTTEKTATHPCVAMHTGTHKQGQFVNFTRV